MYVKAGIKGHERDQPSRSRGLSTRGRGVYNKDKPPVFILADRGTAERHVIPVKAADESTIRLLLADRKEESLTVYADGFRRMNHLTRTTHSLVNTSSMVTVSTLMKGFT